MPELILYCKDCKKIYVKTLFHTDAVKCNECMERDAKGLREIQRIEGVLYG